MIPKKIHYCWFGGKDKSEFIKQCLDTWKEKLPDYEIVEWNETNFNVNMCDFTTRAYENKKWAFVADYARLYALYNYGGIYLDTDVEIVKPFNYDILSQNCFLGFEDSNHLSTACIGAESQSEFLENWLRYYDNIKYTEKDSLDVTPNSEIIFNMIFNKENINVDKIISIDNVTIYPKDYFSPKDYVSKKVTITENTICIHHFDGTWKSGKDRLKDKIKIVIRKILGEKLYLKLKGKIKRKNYDFQK